MSCIYRIFVKDAENPDGHVLSFESEQALDMWIWNNQNLLLDHSTNLIALKEETSLSQKIIDKIENIHNTAKAVASRSSGSNRYMHVTDLWSQINPLNWTKNKSYKSYWISEYKRLNRSASEEDAEQAYKIAEEDDSKTRIGTTLHEYLEDFIAGNTPKVSISTTAQEAANSFKAYLDGKFGKLGTDYFVLTEHSMKSGNINPRIKQYLTALIAPNLPSPTVAEQLLDSIVGTADLIVVTSSGEVHIYDYKTSSHVLDAPNWYKTRGIANSFPRITKQKYEAQAWTYPAILESLGVATNIKAHLAAFHRTDSNIDNFEGVVDFNPVSSTKQRVYNMFNIYTESTIDGMESTHKITKAFFGDQSYVTKEAESYEASVEEFMQDGRRFFKPVDPDSDEGKKGNTLRFYDIVNRKWVYVKNKQTDGRKAVEEYVEALNKSNASRLVDFGKALKNIKTKEELQDFIHGAFGSNGRSLYEEIKKYIDGSWEFVQDDLWNANGIFLFRDGTRYEIVMLDTSKNGMFFYPSLRKGDSILGNFLSNDAYGVDNRHYMEGNLGNMLLIKGAAFMYAHKDMFKNLPVSRIIALNPANGTGITTVPNGWITSNFRMLLFRSGLYKQIQGVEGLFMNDAEAAIAIAEDCLRELSVPKNLWKAEKGPEEEYTVKYLIGILNHLKADTIGIDDSTLQRATAELYKAILWMQNQYVVVTERDVKKYAGAFLFAGGYFAPFAMSPSANLRMINDINIKFTNAIANGVVKRAARWHKLYSENEISKGVLGGEWDYFEQWFEKDENGKISSDFRIKDLNDPYFISNPKAREMAQYMLDTFWELRYENVPIDRGAEEYYWVPLCEASNLEIIQTTGGWKGIRNAVWKSIDRLVDTGKETINGERKNINIDQNLDIPVIKSGYFELSAEARASKLKDPKRGPGFYEKNLDLVFLYALTSGLKERYSKEFMPVFTGVRALLSIENEIGRAGMTDIAKAVDAYISTVVLDKSLIPQELRLINRVLGVIRGAVSKSLLSFSPQSLLRETISNLVRASVEKIAECQRSGEKDKFGNALFDSYTLKDFAKAYEEMLLHLRDGLNPDSKDYQLSSRFRMANTSYREIPYRLRANKYAIRNANSDLWYLNVMTPDYIIRNAVLKATLMSNGSYDSYIMEDGILTYDMKKDKRFSLLFKYAQDGKISRDDYDYIEDPKEQIEYKHQQAIYEHALRDWQSMGEALKYGDYLPEALSPTEQVSVKAQTDKLFGNFDDESKALVQRTMLGGMFFQFKTYGLSRAYDYFKPLGATNISMLRPIKTEEGEQMWIVSASEEEAANGYSPEYIVAESELTDEMRKRARPWYEELGVPNQGKFWNMWNFITALAKGDRDKINQMWADRTKRASLFCILHDVWFFALIAGLLRLIMGEEKIDNLSEQDYWTRWSYAVAMGVAQDGPMWEVAKSLWSDGEMPAFRTLQRWATSVMSVINGNTKVTYALLNSFGATREMTSLMRE